MFYRVIAEILLVLHIVVVVLMAFGWLWTDWWRLYGALLFSTLVSWVSLRGCILVQFENYFRLRSHLQQPPRSGFMGYWGARILGAQMPSDQFMWLWGYVFLTSSSMAWVYRYVWVWY